MNYRLAFAAGLGLCASPAFALNIVLANDDGLTSNLKALHDELTAAGHSVSSRCRAPARAGAARPS